MGCSASLYEMSPKNGDERAHTVLLLGLPDAGKRTLLKQIKIIYTGGFQEDERHDRRAQLDAVILQSIKFLLDQREIEKYARSSSTSEQAYIRLVTKLSEMGTTDHNSPSSTAVSLQEISRDRHSKFSNILKEWIEFAADPRICHIIEVCFTSEVIQLRNHILNNIDRYLDPNYVPSIEDMLHMRLPPSGIMDLRFSNNASVFRAVDLGLQCSDCRKWTHHFHGINALVYVVDTSSYVVEMDGTTSSHKMRESLSFFRSCSKSRWFKDSTVVLFLNKIDVLREKLTRIPLSCCFTDYLGDGTYEDVLRFIKQKFEDLYQKYNDRELFIFPVCATNTSQMKLVFKAVQALALRNTFRTDGLL